MASLVSVMELIIPLCEQLSEKPTLSIASTLSDELWKLDTDIPYHLEDTILSLLIQRIAETDHRNNEIKIHLTNGIAHLFKKKSRIRKISKLKTLTVILLHQIYDPKGNKLIDGISEELKLSIITALESIFRRINSDVMEQMYTKENGYIIAQLTFVCVEIINTEKYRKLRITAINCLLAILQVHNDADFNDTVLRNQISNVVFVIVPKIFYTLQSVALGDEKQGYQLISISIMALGRILCLIMEDYDKNIHSQSPPDISDFKNLILKSMDGTTVNESLGNNNDVLGTTIGKNLEVRKEYIINSTKSPEWLKAASTRLNPFIQALEPLAGNENWKIRMELAQFSCMLIDKCSTNFSACLSFLIRLIILLSQDSRKEIAALCQGQLNQLKGFDDEIERILRSHLTKMTRIICTGDADEQMSSFMLLKGLFNLLPDQSILFNDTMTRNRIFDIIILSIELDMPIDLLHSEHHSRVVDENQSFDGQKLPWKRFKYLRNVKIENIVYETIGSLERFDAIKCYLIDLFEDDNSNLLELVHVLAIIVGKAKNTNEMWEKHVRRIIYRIVEHLKLDLQYKADITTNIKITEHESADLYEDWTEGLYSGISVKKTDVLSAAMNDKILTDYVTINDVKINVLYTCLCLESLGNFSERLQEKYQLYLLQTLPIILDRSGNSNYMIHVAGMYALEKLQKSLKYNSTSELILENIDYISHNINISLKRYDRTRSTIDLLTVVLKYCTVQSIPHLDHMVNVILVESTRSVQSRNVVWFLEIFNVFLKIIKELGDHLMAPETNKNSESVDNEELSENTPTHIATTLSILQFCIKYIACKMREAQIHALDAIVLGLEILRHHENELLPMVHQIWYPFSERIKEQDPIILRKCFSVLCKMADVARDFICQRVSKEMFPFLFGYLEKSAISSLTKGKDVSYTYTQQYKFQNEILHKLSDLLINIEISERDLDASLNATLNFLHQNQPRILQERTVEFLISIAEYDPMAVYVKLISKVNCIDYQENINLIYHRLNII